MGQIRLHKKKSKRMTCHKKYKIEKKVREHNRKVKKEANANSKKKAKKDPGIPNECPFKDTILKEAEDRKERVEKEKQRKKEQRKKERSSMLSDKRNLGSLVRDATKRAQDFERKFEFMTEKSKEYTGGKSVESSLKAYYKEFKKVVEASDVVIQVLDARDPLGSRCPQVEESVLSAGSDKRLVLLLNKIDLVPKENVEAWLKYLRNEFPTMPFKASTQMQNEKLSQSKVPLAFASEDLRKSSCCLGADLLMKLLGNYCRHKDFKTSISVGVVGFPNTGKSSVINSLKRCKACNVGATPGVTKTFQAVQLDKHVKLLDSPGIVMATGITDESRVLRNCVKIETIEDPLPAVTAILKRCTKQQVMMQYDVGSFSTVVDFLGHLAIKMGRLRKGGVPDLNRAAKKVLQDWNMGKIRYYTHPPESHSLPTHLDATLITQMSKEFDIDALLQHEQEDTLKGLKEGSSRDIIVDSEGPTKALLSGEEAEEVEMEDDDEEEAEEEEEEEEEDQAEDEDIDESEEEEMEESEEEETVVEVKKKSGVKVAKAKKSSAKPKQKSNISATNLQAGNLQLHKLRKKDQKKARKERNKAERLSTATGGAAGDIGSDGTANEDYNFEADYDETL